MTYDEDYCNHYCCRSHFARVGRTSLVVWDGCSVHVCPFLSVFSMKQGK